MYWMLSAWSGVRPNQYTTVKFSINQTSAQNVSSGSCLRLTVMPAGAARSAKATDCSSMPGPTLPVYSVTSIPSG